MLKKIFWLLGGLWLALMLAGCMSDVPSPLATPSEMIARLHPSETATLQPTLTATPQPLATRPTMRPKWVSPTGPTRTSRSTYTPTITPTITLTPTMTPSFTPPPPTPTPSRTPVLTPGEDMDLLFLSDGNFFIYNLKTWSAKVWLEINENEFGFKAISDDRRWLVYATDQGAWLWQISQNGEPLRIPVVMKYENARQRMMFKFSPDGQYLAFADDEGFKLLEKPFTGEPTLIQKFDLDLTKDDQHFYFFFADHPILFAPDSKSLFYDNNFIMYQYLIKQKSLVQMGNGFPSGFSLDGKWLLYTLDWMYYFSYEFLHLPSSETTSIDTCQRFDKWAPDSSALPSFSYYSDRDGCRAADGVSLLVPEGDTLVEKVIYQDLETPDDGRLNFGGLLWNETGEKLFFIKNINQFVGDNPYENIKSVDSYLMVYDRESSQTREVAQHSTMIFWIRTDDAILYINRDGSKHQLMRLDMDTEEISLVCKVWDDLYLSDSIPGTDWVIAKRDDLDGYLVLINHRTGAIVSTYFGSVTHSDSYFLGLLPKN